MKERPILFSAPMVRAILDGTKTQTRRVVKFTREPIEHPQMADVLTARIGQRDVWVNSQASHPNHISKACPYGQTGDRLWVREAFHLRTGLGPVEKRLSYRADGYLHMRGWTPSIHMPRFASRILLEISGVRVEKLQDISPEDAEDEGVIPMTGDNYLDNLLRGFRFTWESINGPESWEANPWVWVVEFKRVMP